MTLHLITSDTRTGVLMETEVFDEQPTKYRVGTMLTLTWLMLMRSDVGIRCRGGPPGYGHD